MSAGFRLRRRHRKNCELQSLAVVDAEAGICNRCPLSTLLLCDVNSKNLNKAAEQHTQARKNTDFRRVFDHPEEFDAVVVSTCEHTHAFATLPALQLGNTCTVKNHSRITLLKQDAFEKRRRRRALQLRWELRFTPKQSSVRSWN